MQKKISNNFLASFQNNKCRRLLKQYFSILVGTVYKKEKKPSANKPSNMNRNYKKTSKHKVSKIKEVNYHHQRPDD